MYMYDDDDDVTWRTSPNI